jgi:predicted nuclease of restriction endonuclease-like (RecB) superfamily
MAGKKKVTRQSHDGAVRIEKLLADIRDLILSVRRAIVRSVDTLQVLTSFEIGRRIVEHEQQGAARAEYGKRVLGELADRLTGEFGRGYSRSSLQNMRNFFLVYRDRSSQICQMSSGKWKVGVSEKRQTASGKSGPSTASVPGPPAQFTQPFPLSWSQYVFLLGIDDADERTFYEIESARNSWTLPELKRQFNASLYERLALSRDKSGIRKLAQHGQIVGRPQDLLKEPYVLEFLGLDEQTAYSETDLESAIIDKLEHFLLELGKGYLFEARQKRFTFETDHFFIDLVFYNRLLRCYVLIDLKIGKVTHQDLGQMQMYVNYFDRQVKREDEQPTIGIILCKKKHDALVTITLPKDANIHAREYRLYLPSKEELRRKLVEWAEEQELKL